MIPEIRTFVQRHWWHLLLLIPGALLVTLLHEAAHAFAILLQGGKLQEFVWLPTRDGWGHVAYSFPPGTSYCRWVVSLAPYILWSVLAASACLLCVRFHDLSYCRASLVFFWLFVIPLADIAHAAFPFLAGKENDFATAFGQPDISTAMSISVATLAACIGGYIVQQRFYGQRALSRASYLVLTATALLAILVVTVGLGI